MKNTKHRQKPQTKQSKQFEKRGNSSEKSDRTSRFQRVSKSNNYQDEFADKEKEKGFREGRASLTSKLRANKGMNDISWYNKNPQMIQDAASFPFGIAAGLRYPAERVLPAASLPSSVSHPLIYQAAAFTLPGILTFGIAPTVGISTDDASPINVASLNNYDNVRYKNSGKANYDNPDLTLYYIAMDSIYMYWNWMQRLYGLLRTFDAENRYTPKALIEAQGVDYLDLASNMANFRMYINLAAAQCSAFCVPNTFTYMIRHSWLMSNVYQDQDTQKAQYYMFIPSWVYKYDETSSATGGKLVPVPVAQRISYGDNGKATNLLKFSDIREIMDSLINAALKSEDIGIISGDVLKAYEGSLFTLSAMSEDYKVEPVYNQEVLSQIENLKVVPVETADFNVAGNFDITQDPNTNQIKWNPKFTDGKMFGTARTLINVHKDTVTPDDVMIATRLTACIQRKSSTELRFSAVGSEFVTGMYMHLLAPDFRGASTTGLWMHTYVAASAVATANFNMDLRSVYVPTNYVFSKADLPEGQSAQTYMMTRGWLSMFDWIPLTYTFFDNGSHVFPMPLFGDIDKYAIIDDENLENLNQVALMSMLDVPARR